MHLSGARRGVLSITFDLHGISSLGVKTEIQLLCGLYLGMVKNSIVSKIFLKSTVSERFLD